MRVAQPMVGAGVEALIWIDQPNPRSEKKDARAEITAKCAFVRVRRLGTSGDLTLPDLAEGLIERRRIWGDPGSHLLVINPRGTAWVELADSNLM
jgi:hypothetical protein